MFTLKKNTTKIFIFANAFLLLNSHPTFGQCINKNCSVEKKYRVKVSNLGKFIKSKNTSSINFLDHEIQTLNNTSLRNILVKDNIRLDHFIYAITANNFESKFNKNLSVEIESDKQYRENDIYYAEGNVILKFKNGILKSDKFSYDRKTGRVKLIDNVFFEKGDQYFKASFIDYDSNKQQGEIINIAGILSLNNLEKDLNLYQIDKKSCAEEELDLLDLSSELELLNTKNVRLNNILGLNSDFGKISNWKFRSKKISVKKNLWQSENIEFTNDPYENPQFLVESNNFSAEIINDTYKFTSKSTFLNLENKIKIPVGNRTISDEDVSIRWGIGYDKNKRDGLYLYRSSNIFELTKNLEFSYKPYFLIERALRGKTKSFRLEDSSFIDDKVSQNTKYSDFLGIQANIKGKLFNWDSNVNLDLGSFNENRLNDSLTIDANISKTLYSSSNQFLNNKCSLKNKRTYQTFSVKSGFYGAYLKDNIYSAYGKKLITEYTSAKKNISDNYSLILDIGNYQSKSLDNKKLLSLDRYGINASFKRSYKLFDLNDENFIYDSQFNKTPKIVNKAFFLNTKISTSTYQYSNEKNQRIFVAGIGPSFTLGNLKNNFLDYSNLSIMPEFIQKKGKSPFAFDDFNSHSRIKFDFKQQIYGPILMGLSSDLIISNKSENYGEFENTQYSLDISRRAYNISFFYKNKQSFGLKFNIFNFDLSKFDRTSN